MDPNHKNTQESPTIKGPVSSNLFESFLEDINPSQETIEVASTKEGTIVTQGDSLAIAKHSTTESKQEDIVLSDLTEHQYECAQFFIDYIEGRGPYANYRAVGLRGGAGVGKSYTLAKIIARYSGVRQVVCSALSHVATNVVKDNLDGVGGAIRISTLASAIGIVLQYDDKGNTFFRVDERKHKNCNVKAAQLLIIDECSQISSYLHNLIVTTASKYCKIIFVGDACQLPPVDPEKDDGKKVNKHVEPDSPTFDYPYFELTEVLRYTNAISTIGDMAREEIRRINNGQIARMNLISKLRRRKKEDWNPEDGGYKFLKGGSNLLDTYMKHHKEQEDNVNHIRVVAFHNRLVDSVNYFIRQAKYGTEANVAYHPGEFIVMKAPYKEDVKNGQIFKVQEVAIREYKQIECWALNIGKIQQSSYRNERYSERQSSNDDIILYIPTPVGEWKYKETLATLAEDAKNADYQQKSSKWAEYHAYKDSFAKVNYAYAITSHSACTSMGRIKSVKLRGQRNAA